MEKMTKEIANKWMQDNLYWIVPVFFVTIITGFGQAIYQRDQNDMEIISNTEVIKHQIELDTTVIPKIDSLKETLKKMK